MKHPWHPEKALAAASAAVAEIVGTRALDPDTILAAADARGMEYAFVLIPSWEEHESGPGLYTKSEIFKAMFSAALPVGEVLMVSDAGIAEGSVVSCESESLGDMVSSHPSFLFDGDVVFVWPTALRLSVFHHEGGYAHLG